MKTALRVVKLGGSLLAQAECAANLHLWLSTQPCLKTVLIVGGGEKVDHLRRQQLSLELTDEQAHFVAIDLMVENSISLIGHFPEAHFVSDLFSITASPSSSMHSPNLYFFDSRVWSRSNRKLPRNWMTTSDSIAAAISCELAASELVLLKSTLPVSLNPVEIAASQLVDAEFRNWISRLERFRIVNLASQPFSEVHAMQTANTTVNKSI